MPDNSRQPINSFIPKVAYASIIFFWGQFLWRALPEMRHGMPFAMACQFFLKPLDFYIPVFCLIILTFFKMKKLSLERDGFTSIQFKERTDRIIIGVMLMAILPLIFLKWIDHNGLMVYFGPMIPLAIVTAVFFDGWIKTQGSWNPRRYPKQHQITLFVIATILFSVWNVLWISALLGGSLPTPQILYFFSLQAGVLFGLSDACFTLMDDTPSSKDLFKLSVTLIMIGMVVSLIIYFVNFRAMDLSHLSARYSEARRCYLSGNCYDAGQQQFGGWLATFFITVLSMVMGLYLYTVFTVGMLIKLWVSDKASNE